jgi:hypothetical protein
MFEQSLTFHQNQLNFPNNGVLYIVYTAQHLHSSISLCVWECAFARCKMNVINSYQNLTYTFKMQTVQYYKSKQKETFFRTKLNI